MHAPEYKSCPQCGEQFGRNVKHSERQWQEAQFCSRGCAARYRYRDRPPRPVRPIRPTYGSKRRVRRDGYVDVYEPQHPLARRDGYVGEHRKVAWDAGVLTDPSHNVHHENGDKADNRLENLAALPHAEHARLHNPFVGGIAGANVRKRAAMGDRACAVCGADITPRRIDAVVCSGRCREARWKARNS